MKTVIFDADPFCFGPISTTLNVARELRACPGYRDARFVLLATGTSHQLARIGEGMDEIIECDTTKPDALLAHRALIESASVYVANTNFLAVHALLDSHVRVPIVFIDTLYWMWDQHDPYLDRVHTVVAQDFWGVRERAAALPPGVRRPHVVPPLIRCRPPSPPARRDLILVNLGGIENVYSSADCEYHAPRLVEAVLQAVDAIPALRGREKLICGGGLTIGKIAAAFASAERCIRVDTLSQTEFLDQLARASHFLTLPGLTSLVEGEAAGANAFLLLPQNYSQYRQLELARAHLPHVRGLNFTAFEGFEPIGDGEEELVGVARVQAYNRAFFSAPSLVARYRDEVREYLLSAPVGTPSREGLFGVHRNGPAQAAALVARAGDGGHRSSAESLPHPASSAGTPA